MEKITHKSINMRKRSTITTLVYYIDDERMTHTNINYCIYIYIYSNAVKST